jgi:hypothetical protein
VDAQAGAPEHDDQSAQPRSVQAVSGVTHHRDDLVDGRRIGRIALALVAGRASSVEQRPDESEGGDQQVA